MFSLSKAGVLILSGMIAVSVSFADGIDLARAEYGKYYRQITGRTPTKESVRFAIDRSISKRGNDAYTIRSETGGAVITGSNVRSLFYGLYDLLERRGGCHWFWDIDVVPHKEDIDLTGLDVNEEARFEYRGLRYFAHRGLTRFQAEHWGLDDWKREIDWCLKRRLNVFMLRIGQDDLFQRTFPDIVSYPDASKNLPGTGKGYDNRTLFWSLEYRGKLRHDLQQYAFARGLMVPEDFGTMTHWYSRTPEEFLEKMNPPFLPQTTAGYSEKNGLVWDVRDDKWVDAYWKLTQTAVEAYGQGKDRQQLLHTIGLGERRCYTNRQENLELKIASLKKFLARAHRDYPNAKTLLAGWDFYFTWRPEEVQELVRSLDPKRDIIWDYEGDSTRDYRPEMLDLGGNNFTKWGVVGKFPYTFSVFLAFENALDVRANYPLIEERQKIVQDDSACVGYIFWPESSHTDTLLLRFFTANAWSSTSVSHRQVLDEFCNSRYGALAPRMKSLWEKVIPVSYMSDWGSNYSYLFTRKSFGTKQYGPAGKTDAETWGRRLAEAKGVFAELAKIEWQGEAVRRDTIDLARTVLDRMMVMEAGTLAADFEKWQGGAENGAKMIAAANRLAGLADRMADLLELHTDYSLWESYLRLNEIEPVRNPNFPSVLFENAANTYCQSHQYELARYWYAPRAHEWAAKIETIIRSKDRKSPLQLESGEVLRNELQKRPLETLRPRSDRSPKVFAALMEVLSESP